MIFKKNNALVWDETVQIMNDLFDNVWGDRSEVVVDHCVDITLPVSPHMAHTLFISQRLP